MNLRLIAMIGMAVCLLSGCAANPEIPFDRATSGDIKTSDPKTIGQQISRISETTQTMTLMSVTPAAVVAASYHSGDDSTADFVGALNGTTVVDAKFIPKAK